MNGIIELGLPQMLLAYVFAVVVIILLKYRKIPQEKLVFFATIRMSFQSIHHPEICFILANPEAFALRKPEAFSQEVLTMLSVPSKEDLDVAYLLSVTDSLEQATVNLKSPIVFNPQTRQGAQIILNEDLPLRERLFASC